MLLLLIGMFVARSVSHTITTLEVPLWADPRREAELRCQYMRQQHDPPLHSVKWYRDMHEIFRYTPQELETRAFNSTGISVTNSSCDPRACVITVRPERGTAKYTCEVSSEGPRFAVDKRSANMTLAVMPEYDPLITGLPTLVQVGEQALVNCTSDYSLPAATIDWFVDSEPQEDPLITPDTVISGADGDGLRASWRTLHVYPDDYPTHRGYLALRCRATIATRPPHVRSMSVRLYVASRPHISSYMFSKNSKYDDKLSIKVTTSKYTFSIYAPSPGKPYGASSRQPDGKDKIDRKRPQGRSRNRWCDQVRTFTTALRQAENGQAWKHLVTTSTQAFQDGNDLQE